MVRCLLVTLLSVGCRQLLGFEDVAGLVDARGANDASAANCFGSGVGSVCLDALPTEAVTLSEPIDTDTSSCVGFTSSNGTVACVIAGTQITVAGTVVATGSRPLVLVSTTTLDVLANGAIDASSRRSANFPVMFQVGAGSSSSCTPGTQATAGTTGGGGAGGTFGGRGGNGSVDAPTGGSSGVAPSPAALTELRGGCSGGDGAGIAVGDGGVAGIGGGAVFLIAVEQITIAGTINASGAGGGFGRQRSGGGGGGSGGLIGLDAENVTLSEQARVFANGGGGGEGGDSSQVGGNGSEATSPLVAASGAAGGSPGGGNGGNGSAAATVDGGSGIVPSTDAGGGGGGGGAGVVKVHAEQSSGTGVVSPPTS